MKLSGETPPVFIERGEKPDTPLALSNPIALRKPLPLPEGGPEGQGRSGPEQPGLRVALILAANRCQGTGSSV